MTFEEFWKSYQVDVEHISWVNIKDVPKMIARAAWESAMTNTVGMNASQQSIQADAQHRCALSGRHSLYPDCNFCPNCGMKLHTA